MWENWRKGMRHWTSQRRAAREQEVLAYPPLALRRHADLSNPDEASQSSEPMTVGFGPAGEALVLWPHDGDRAVVSHHSPDGRFSRSTPLLAQPFRRSVQPMPDGQVLLVSGRCEPGEHNAVVYDDCGQLVRTAHLGDGIAHVLSTASGAVWTGYFDEGVFASEGPNRHGLVRFGPDLSPQWLYPGAAEPVLPSIDDCYALNVEQERAWTYAYSDFHLVSVEGELAYDHGLVPLSGAHALLVDGSDAALIGGYAGRHHLITPLRITPDGVQLAGPPRRLVLPDGAPVPLVSYSGRGAELHVAVGATWYRLSLEDIAR